MAESEEIEEIDGVLVIGEGIDRAADRVAPRTQSSSVVSALTAPTVQAAAMAAGGFLAGAAVIGLVGHRLHSRRVGSGPVLSRRAVGRRRGATVGEQLVQIVGTRSVLVDVHLLGPER